MYGNESFPLRGGLRRAYVPSIESVKRKHKGMTESYDLPRDNLTRSRHKTLRIEAIKSLAEMETQAAEWDALALAAAHKRPMSSYAWVSAFLEHRLKPGESWLCLLAYDGAVLVGALPLVVGSRRLTSGGIPLQVPFDWHTFSVDILALPGREEEGIPSLLSSIGRFIPSWSGLRLMRLPRSSPTLAVVGHGVPGLRAVATYDGDGSFISLQGCDDAYPAGLSRNFRRNLTKARNKLAELRGVEIISVEGVQADPSHLEAFADLEASGWKGRVGSAIKGSPDLMKFYYTLTRRLAAAGWLQWYFLRAEGKVVAAKMNVKFGPSLVMCKIAYDEAYARCSPGNLLLERILQDVCRSRSVQRIDLVTDMPWHANWNPQTESYFHVRLYPTRPMPLLLGYLPFRVRRVLADRPLLTRLIRGARAAMKWLKKAAPIPPPSSDPD